MTGLQEGEQLKKRGMALAAKGHAKELERAREVAMTLAVGKSITASDVRDHLIRMGEQWNLGNAAGSIFKGPQWECVGFTKATHAKAHARMVRAWKLKVSKP